MQNISCKDWHHIGERHAQSQRSKRQDQLCASIPVCPHVSKAVLDALKKRFTGDWDRLTAALRDAHLDCPDRCEQKHRHLHIVGAMHATVAISKPAKAGPTARELLR